MSNNEQFNIALFLKDYGGHILGLIGIVQLWILGIWKKWWLKGTITVFKTGQVEVGYSTFGPTLALNGTLRAEKGDVFISNIELTVEKISDHSQHSFEWAVFRSPQIKLDIGSTPTLELPSGFNVGLNQPHRYQILFMDRKIQSEIRPYLEKLIQDWNDYVQKKSPEIQVAISNGMTYDRALEHFYDTDFTKTRTDIYMAAYEILSRKMYWEASTYKFKMILHAASPTQTFGQEFRFDLTEDHFKDIKLNAVTILREVCISKAHYYFAYVAYE